MLIQPSQQSSGMESNFLSSFPAAMSVSIEAIAEDNGTTNGPPLCWDMTSSCLLFQYFLWYYTQQKCAHTRPCGMGTSGKTCRTRTFLFDYLPMREATSSRRTGLSFCSWDICSPWKPLVWGSSGPFESYPIKLISSVNTPGHVLWAPVVILVAHGLSCLILFRWGRHLLPGVLYGSLWVDTICDGGSNIEGVSRITPVMVWLWLQNERRWTQPQILHCLYWVTGTHMWIICWTRKVTVFTRPRGIIGGKKRGHRPTRLHPRGGVSESRGFCGVWWYQTGMDGGDLGSRGEALGSICDITPPYSRCHIVNIIPLELAVCPVWQPWGWYYI